MTDTTTNRTRPAAALLYALVGLALIAAAVVLLRPARPRLLAAASAAPVAPLERGGAWYWIEQPQKQPARLVRAAEGADRAETIATAAEIAGFDTDGKLVAWTQRDGGEWSVRIAAPGDAPRVVWSGTQAAGRPCLAGGIALWTVARPGLLEGASPQPALAGTTDVMATAAAASAVATRIGALREADAQLIGAGGGVIYLAARRQGSTALYRMSLAGASAAPVRRLAGEAGAGVSAAVTDDGALWWSAPSRDSSDPGTRCVRRATPNGTPITMADWLPTFGEVFAAGTGAWYVDGTAQRQAFALLGNDRLPAPAPVPPGYGPLAVSEREMLLMTSPAPNGRLYVVPKP